MLIETISFSSVNIGRRIRRGRGRERETTMKIEGSGISGEGNVKGVQANLSAPDTSTSRDDDEADRTRRCVPTREKLFPTSNHSKSRLFIACPGASRMIVAKDVEACCSHGLSCPDTWSSSSSLNRSRAIDRLESFKLALSNFTAKRPYSCFHLPFASPRYSRVDLVQFSRISAVT